MISINEIEKADKDKKLIIGKKIVIKALSNDGLKKVVLASNTPSDLKEAVDLKASSANVTVETINLKNDELGSKCKRPFSISILGIKK